MLCTFAPAVNAVSEVQRRKVSVPMAVMPLPSVTDERAEQAEKAPSPRDFTLSGTKTLVRALQPLNAFVPMEVSFPPKVTDGRSRQYSNACAPIEVTLSGSVSALSRARQLWNA